MIYLKGALPKVEHKEMKTLTADQLSTFFQEARDSGVYELYYLDLATGLRRGELLGLKWTDVDLDRGVLKIQRAISRQNGKVVEAMSASSEESAGAAADLALRAAERHERKVARKAEKADTQAVRDGSAARQRPSSRLQFTEEERADPVLGKYIDRSDRAADRLEIGRAHV